jgi:long-chain acyl-CoA synthetase
VVRSTLHPKPIPLIVTIEPLDSTALVTARIAFSVPIVNAYPNPLSAGPVFASHPLDMQQLETNQAKMSHCGPPTCNIEVKLLGINEAAVETGSDPLGELCVRGPGVGDPIPMGVQLEDGWIDIGVKARARANGTFFPDDLRV